MNKFITKIDKSVAKGSFLLQESQEEYDKMPGCAFSVLCFLGNIGFTTLFQTWV